jgi:hypothetical protein
MQVAIYLYLSTFMPAASAVAGFSPTERRLRPILVLVIITATITAITIERYVINP